MQVVASGEREALRWAGSDVENEPVASPRDVKPGVDIKRAAVDFAEQHVDVADDQLPVREAHRGAAGAAATGLYEHHRATPGGTKVTDAGLKELATIKSLQNLQLYGTQVTNAGLKELAGLKSLKCLNLSSTQVTDAGLAHLKALPHLMALSLERTGVTAAGLKQLDDIEARTRRLAEDFSRATVRRRWSGWCSTPRW